ncbi:hypothetical protein J6U78_03650 [bacterium]|nr:hypothetical protein [bacterium]
MTNEVVRATMDDFTAWNVFTVMFGCTAGVVMGFACTALVCFTLFKAGEKAIELIKYYKWKWQRKKEMKAFEAQERKWRGEK